MSKVFRDGGKSKPSDQACSQCGHLEPWVAVGGVRGGPVLVGKVGVAHTVYPVLYPPGMVLAWCRGENLQASSPHLSPEWFQGFPSAPRSHPQVVCMPELFTKLHQDLDLINLRGAHGLTWI